jgi:hypothetical protein
MIESHWVWPAVRVEKLDPNWWTEVMRVTAMATPWLDPRLSDSEDFVLRSMIYMAFMSPPEQISWMMDGSFNEERLLIISDQLHSGDYQDRVIGQVALGELIDEFTEDSLNGLKF